MSIYIYIIYIYIYIYVYIYLSIVLCLHQPSSNIYSPSSTSLSLDWTLDPPLELQFVHREHLPVVWLQAQWKMEGGWRWYATIATSIGLRWFESSKNHKCSNKPPPSNEITTETREAPHNHIEEDTSEAECRSVASTKARPASCWSNRREFSGQKHEGRRRKYLFFIFWCKDLVTLTILRLYPKDFDIYDSKKSKESNCKATAVKLPSSKYSITKLYHYLSHTVSQYHNVYHSLLNRSPHAFGALPLIVVKNLPMGDSSERPNTWRSHARYARCLAATAGVSWNSKNFWRVFFHFDPFCTTIAVNLQTPLSCSQCCGGRR